MGNELIFASLIALGVVILVIFVFLFVKDSENTRKLKQFERSIEELNVQIFKLQKRLKESELQKETPDKNSEHNLRVEFKKELASYENSFRKAIESLESVILHQRDELSDKIALLEEKVKDALYFPAPSTSTDENKIISMFQGGWSVDSIAKELRLPKGEVEFILKLSNIK